MHRRVLLRVVGGPCPIDQERVDGFGLLDSHRAELRHAFARPGAADDDAQEFGVGGGARPAQIRHRHRPALGAWAVTVVAGVRRKERFALFDDARRRPRQRRLGKHDRR